MECVDFLEFQDGIKKSRDLDDKIIYTLNTTLPTTSFRSDAESTKKCKDLYTKLEENYTYRENSIKKCIVQSADHVKTLLSHHEANPDDVQIMKQLKKEQNKVRLLKTELNVEEIVKDRSIKLFYERCRPYYKPSNLQI